jgi:hypothetical protein
LSFQISVFFVYRTGLFIPQVKNFSKIHLVKRNKEAVWLQI